MPNLSEQDYLKLKTLVSSPDSGISDAVRERALAAIDGYQQQYETGMRGGVSEEQALAMGPESPPNDLVSRLNPSLPLIPQALAVQPATTHPGGDEAAQNEWLAGGGANSKGTVFVYEPPLDAAKQELLANPQIATTLFPNVGQPFTAEEIAGLSKDNEIYQAYADHKWRQYAEQAAKDGKTAYRYSKAPWLHSGDGMSRLGSFGTKLLGSIPEASGAAAAAVMGVDDATFFGAGRAVAGATEEPGAPPVAGQRKEGLPDFVGLGSGSTEETIEENPGAFTGGQVLGMLKGWGPADSLWNFVRSGGQSAAARAGGGLGGLAARTAAGAGAASVAATAEEGIKGLVAGEGLPGAAQRAENSLLSPFAPLMGGAGEMLGSAARVAGEATRHGGRYGGAPGRLEAMGVEFKLGGPTTPAGAADAVRMGREKDVSPQDVRAKELAPKLEEGASAIRSERAKAIGEQNEQFYNSREGQLLLPVSNVLETTASKLRSQYQRDGQRMKPIAGAGQKLHKFKAILNENIGTVSLEPVEGAIELSTEEAGKFLSTRWKRKLIPDTPPPKGGGGGGGAREVDLGSGGDAPDLARPEQGTMDVRAEDIEDVGEASAGTVPQNSDTPAASVAPDPSPPGRGTPTRQTPARNADIREYGEAMEPGREARAAEAGRLAKLAKDHGLTAAGATTAAALGDEEDAGTAAAAAGFVSALRKKGAGKVYIVPRRSNARDHETLIHNYNPEIPMRDKNGAETTYLDRDLADIRDAAYRDRDARPMGGQAGGWSESQRKAREALREAEDIQKRVGRGDRAFGQVVDFATQHPGQMLNKEALEAAAQRSGVREQLDAVRALDPWRYLQNNITYGRNDSGRPSIRSSVTDAAYLRAGYPAVKRLENPKGMTRGGKLGRFSLLRGNGLAIEEEEQEP